MTPRALELVASGVLIAGGLALAITGHWIGGFASVGVGLIAALDSLASRR